MSAPHTELLAFARGRFPGTFAGVDTLNEVGLVDVLRTLQARLRGAQLAFQNMEDNEGVDRAAVGQAFSDLRDDIEALADFVDAAGVKG